MVAGFAGVDLVLDEAMRERIADIVAAFPRAGRDPALAAAVRKQALVPRGAVARPGRNRARARRARRRGSAGRRPPGSAARAARTVARRARDRADARALTVPPAAVRLLRYYGLSEAEIAATLRAEESRDIGGVEVTTCLRRSELEVDLRPRPGAEDAATWLAGQLAERHADYLIAQTGRAPTRLLAGALLAAGLTIGTAESCTGGGLLAGRLTDRPGSSLYVAGAW